MAIDGMGIGRVMHKHVHILTSIPLLRNDSIANTTAAVVTLFATVATVDACVRLVHFHRKFIFIRK